MSSSAARAWRSAAGAGLCRTLGSTGEAAVATRGTPGIQMQGSRALDSSTPRRTRKRKLVPGWRFAHGTSAVRHACPKPRRLEVRAWARCSDEPNFAAYAASMQKARNSNSTVGRLHRQHVCEAGGVAVAAQPAGHQHLPRVLPNPSLKPSPNSRALGRRGCAVHHQPRRPSARLSGPA